MNKDLVLVKQVEGDAYATQIEAILNDNSIPCVKKYSSDGALAHLYMGATNHLIEFYISPDDVERAKVLLENFEVATTSLIDSIYDDENVQAMIKSRKLIQDRLSLIILIFVTLALVGAVAFSLIN
ncbi:MULTISPECIES: hypothetical protein [unclassified Fusibacter]|uniref:hypothetical protein n=1 Tax=unclassified Fusibacter TaxID=2624464 RepID=UPI0010124341|nr:MULTISPECIES: hypothetical protein [unclassified Fusibacter]MCK8058999.1 hypothetical protein [Fusibacter sp. A2]NPE22410.1 hypothetical protein [Fusibacter sp. A1]RXV60516.1 hypothetical protein DWB64_11230 [Fusibacter sp. A1]